MPWQTSSERMGNALERTCRLTEAHLKREARESGHLPPGYPPFTIALSRATGAGGAAVAREVSARLGWRVYDHELLQQLAQNMGWRAEWLKSAEESHVSWLQQHIETLLTGVAIDDIAYARELTRTVLALGKQGQCVIVGRGAAQILPEATTLRVRLVASLEDRITRRSQRLGISRGEAAAQIQTIDAGRLRFVLDHFRQDPADKCLYDLVLNSSRYSVDECADLIIGGLNQLTRKPQ